MTSATRVHASDNFDLLRAAGALFTIFSHSFAVNGLPEPPVPGVVHFGGLGVSIFFCISGYLIAQSWDRDPRLLAFLAKRSLRIFPALAVVVVLSVFVLGPLLTMLPLRAYFRDPATVEYLQNIGLFNMVYRLPGVFDDLPVRSVVNGSLWTLPVEFVMYLLVALFGVVAQGRRWIYATAFAAAVAASLGWAMRTPDPVWLGMDVRYVATLGTYFFAGACAYAYGLDRRLSAPALALCGFAMLCTLWSSTAITIALWFALPAFVIAIGRGSSRAGRWVARNGDLSYGLYIYAFPVQQVTRLYWPNAPFVAYVAVVIAITALLAYASWRWIEKPALALKPRPAPRTSPVQAMSADLRPGV